MPASFLHGFEFIETAPFQPVRMVRSAIIGLVGSAPQGPINTPTLVMSRSDAAQFGAPAAGYTIPQALQAILAQGDEVGFVVVVNVFDPAVHKTSIVGESQTFDAGKNTLALAHGRVAAVVVKNSGGTVTYTVGTDYTVDALKGVITRVATGAITAGQTVAVSYDYADPTKVLSSTIIGGVDQTTGDRSGIEALLDASSIYGFAPKILIAPQYSSAKLVMDALLAKATSLRAMAIADQAAGATREEALAYRMEFDNMRAIVTAPLLKTQDADGNTITVPYSPYLAGVISRTDNQLGFWHSPSNKPILGITDLERPVPFLTFHSADSEANYLNENQIVTAIHYEGFRVWGNRSAVADTSFQFIAVRRQFDVIEDSIELGTIALLDRPINKAFFEDLTDTVQAFLAQQIGRGALVAGTIKVLPEDNPPTELANGHVTARLDLTPVYPAERITYNAVLDIAPLATLFQ
jgi:phage tail sheath protein FI